MNKQAAKRKIVDEIMMKFSRELSESYAGDEATIGVPVRIAVDFLEFLETYDHLENAEPEEVDYVVNTIRSGMDYYFSCEQYYRVAVDHPHTASRWAIHSEYAMLRNEYLEVFTKMRASGLLFGGRLSELLRLVELQLQFLAAKFHIS